MHVRMRRFLLHSDWSFWHCPTCGSANQRRASQECEPADPYANYMTCIWHVCVSWRRVCKMHSNDKVTVNQCIGVLLSSTVRFWPKIAQGFQQVDSRFALYRAAYKLWIYLDIVILYLVVCSNRFGKHMIQRTWNWSRGLRRQDLDYYHHSIAFTFTRTHFPIGYHLFSIQQFASLKKNFANHLLRFKFFLLWIRLFLDCEPSIRTFWETILGSDPSMMMAQLADYCQEDSMVSF